VAAAQRVEPCQARADEGVILGTVVDLDTRIPLTQADVELSWRPDRGRERDVELETDEKGQFRFCEAPAGVRVIVRASFGGKSSRSAAVTVDPGGEARVDLEIDAPHSEIVGRVVEYGSGRPVNAATVRLAGTPLTQVTPPDGKFRFPDVPPGAYQVDIEHLGYRAVRDSVQLDLGTNMDITVRLAPNVIPLEPLVVTVRSMLLERHGFYDRQQRGLGDYITRDEIEKNNPMHASDILRGLAGIRLVPRRSGMGYAPLGRGNCGFRYILNGARVGPGFEIDDISAEWIEAIEIYRGPASVPAEFASLGAEIRGNCGVIVIWTRSR
jgi:hypothetical protein